MAQVDTFIYAKFDDGVNAFEVGSKTNPLTYTFSNTPFIDRRPTGLSAAGSVWTPPYSAFLTDGDLIQIWVRATEAGVLAWKGDAAADVSSIGIAANVWTPLLTGITTADAATAALKAAATQAQIEELHYEADAYPCDVQVIVVADVLTP